MKLPLPGVELAVESRSPSIDANGEIVDDTVVLMDRYGHRFSVSRTQLQASLDGFVGRPQTPEVLAEIGRITDNYIREAAMRDTWTWWNTTPGGLTVNTAESAATTWSIWTSGDTVTATASNDGAWNYWNVGSGIITDSTTRVWGNWNGSVTVSFNPHFQVTDEQLRMTPEQQARARELLDERRAAMEREQREWEERQQRWARQRQEEEKKLEVARLEARALLESLLSPAQRASLEQEDWFLVMGKSGSIYRLRRGRVGNVDLVGPDGKVLRKYCVHPGTHLPNFDDLAAQKLHLENDDTSLIELANMHADLGNRGEVIDLSKHLPMREAA